MAARRSPPDRRATDPRRSPPAAPARAEAPARVDGVARARRAKSRGNGETVRPSSPPQVLKVRSPRRRVLALTGVNTLLGKNLLGLYEEDPRVGKIVALDVQ